MMPKLPSKSPASAASSCKKVANPCKICLQPVSAKDGVQCQGACEAWVHYECLNYTPGKVKDIKGGLITITCPCPDCKTSVPKEFRTEQPFTCNNVMCPANNPPSCDAFDCQANEASRSMPARCPPPGTLRSCAPNICRDYSGPTCFTAPPNDVCMEGFTLTYCGETGTPMIPPQYPKPGLLPGLPGLCGPNRTPGMQGMQGMPGMQMPGQLGQGFSPEAMQQMCKTVGELAQQLNNLMAAFGGPPASAPASAPGAQGVKPCGSDGVTCGGNAGCNKCAASKPPQNTLNAGTLKKPGCTGGCGQAGQTGCAQPCHCPGKPTQK